MAHKLAGPTRAGSLPAAPAGAMPQAQRGPADVGDDALGLWLRSSLRRHFADVAAEPIPKDLLRLIEEDRAERERIRLRRLGGRGE